MEELIGNYYFVYPLIAHMVATAMKLTAAARKGQLSWNVFVQYGGFPSSHSAIVTSLATIIAIKDGVDTSAFAIAIIVALLIVRDAFGLRQIVEKHDQVISRLDKQEGTRIKLPLEVGHSLFEVIAGVILGFVVTVVLTLL